MALLNVEKNEHKVRGCICGKDKNASVYRTPELSPDRTDITIGTVVLLAIEIGLAVLMVIAETPTLIPYVVLPLPLLILALGVYRSLKGHRLACAFRWAYVAVAGAGRFLSF